MLYSRILWACVLVTAASIGWMVWAPNTHKAEDRAAAKTAVETYIAAFVRGDGYTACNGLTNTAREAVINAAGRVGAASCPDAFEKTRKLGGREVTGVARKIRVTNVSIANGRAKVTLNSAGLDSVAEVEKEGGKWKIASLPKS
ncbi:MAG: hypothetical protein QOJ12_2642 [Thermoleophilales bacterium]|jgi:hypothetical protein|nr:hypothetical protein [Thermoleophilales bacterium]